MIEVFLRKIGHYGCQSYFDGIFGDASYYVLSIDAYFFFAVLINFGFDIIFGSATSCKT
jgi:hypothetical protein